MVLGGIGQRHSDYVLWDLVRLKCLGAPERIEWPTGLFYGEEWFWARMLALVKGLKKPSPVLGAF